MLIENHTCGAAALASAVKELISDWSNRLFLSTDNYDRRTKGPGWMY